MAVLGLCCGTRAFSSCGERGLLYVVVCGLLTAVAFLVVEHRLQVHGLQQLCHAGFSSCGARAQLLRGRWDIPRPGLEPVSPALAGGFLTTAPPGKSPIPFLYSSQWLVYQATTLLKTSMHTMVLNVLKSQQLNAT